MTTRFPLRPWLLAVWISACASPAELPEADSTVREWYRQAMLPGAPTPMVHPMPVDSVGRDPFTAEMDRQLRRDFRVLANPRLVLYVYPHLTAAGTPIPGYATWFHVFEQGPVFEVVR